MLRYETYDAGKSVKHGENILHLNLYRNRDEQIAASCMDFFANKEKDEFCSFIVAANDALDEIEALVTVNEDMNLNTGQTHRNMVDILIRAGRR